MNIEISQVWLEKLRAGGMRITAPRREITRMLAESRFAQSPQGIYAELRKTFPGIGLVTIYRTVESLERLGAIQRVHHPEGCHMFIRKQEGHTHILICRKCGKVDSVSGDDLTNLVSIITRQTGFLVQDHWLQFFGICPDCQGN